MGALDMGGASTQICFAPRGPILDQSSQAIFRLYGTNYSIYTHSHLCFGRDQALLRLLARLLQVGQCGEASVGTQEALAGAQPLAFPVEQPDHPAATPVLPQWLPDHPAPGHPV